MEVLNRIIKPWRLPRLRCSRSRGERLKQNPGFAKRLMIRPPRAIGTGHSSDNNRWMFELKHPSFSSPACWIAMLVQREKPTSRPNSHGVFSPVLSRFQQMLEAPATSSASNLNRSAPPASFGMGVLDFPWKIPRAAQCLYKAAALCIVCSLHVGPTLSAPQPLARFPCCSGSCPQCHGVPLYPPSL